MVVHACITSFLVGRGMKIAWTWELKVSVIQDHAIALHPRWQRKNSISKKERIRKKREDPKKHNQNHIGSIMTNPTEIQKILGDYYEQLYEYQLENLEKTDKFETILVNMVKPHLY